MGKMKNMKRLVLVLLLCSSAFAANDFTTDSDVVAHWRFEAAGEGVDETDYSHDLSDYFDKFSIDTDEGDFMEGAGSAYTPGDASQALYRTDAGLHSDFPFENSNSEGDYSICFWINFDAVVEGQCAISKYHWSGDQRSFAVSFLDNGSADFTLQITHGYNTGASAENIDFDTDGLDMAATTWYHVGIAYTAADNTLDMRICEDGETAKLDINETFSNTIWLGSTEDWCIGSTSGKSDSKFAGHIDELVVWKRVISTDEMAAVQAGTFTLATTSAAQIF